MYHAIVFLPLLGSIIAAVIELVGARRRHPGGSPPPGMEDTATDHGPHRGGGAPSMHADAAVIHAAHAEPEEHEPPAEGSRAAEVVTTAFLMIAMVLSWIAFAMVGFGEQDV